MKRLSSLAIFVLLSAALFAGEAGGDTSRPITPAKKRPSAITAAKRSKAVPPATLSAHSRSRGTASAQSRSVHAGTRKVIVTRKKVNGRWVRSTQIVRVPPAPTYQLHPDPERYQQIQQALAAKGFFKGEANGEWGDDSVDALKRFQASSNLPNDGKISSLSIIGLGLGPKHDGSVTPQPAGTPAPTPSSPSQP